MTDHPNRSRANNPESNPAEKKHGGARSGSGRKKMEPEQKKQKITFALSDDVIDFLKSNRPAARTLEKAVREYAKRLEQTTNAAHRYAEQLEKIAKNQSPKLR